MKRTGGCLLAAALVGFVAAALAPARADDPPKGFVALFDGKDFSGWKVPVGDNGHWKIVDGAIDYDAKSEAKGQKHLWTEKAYKNFTLLVDWRFKTDQKGYPNKVPILLPDGTSKKGDDGKEIKVDIEDVDSGIYLRGQEDAQINIWMWPCGSGEVWGYRTKKNATQEQKAACTPSKKMDKARGEWNTFEITMKADRLWVKLNGETVINNARLEGVAASGPIALQHHGTWSAAKNGWTGPPALIQFKNICIKELPD
jgi:hypothetical protein